jgi:hypothetical protein
MFVNHLNPERDLLLCYETLVYVRRHLSMHSKVLVSELLHNIWYGSSLRMSVFMENRVHF